MFLNHKKDITFYQEWSRYWDKKQTGGASQTDVDQVLERMHCFPHNLRGTPSKQIATMMGTGNGWMTREREFMLVGHQSTITFSGASFLVKTLMNSLNQEGLKCPLIHCNRRSCGLWLFFFFFKAGSGSLLGVLLCENEVSCDLFHLWLFLLSF